MGDLFPGRIETDRLVLEALRTDTVDPLTYYEHASSDRMEDGTTYLPGDPHEHPKESLNVIREAEEAREADEHARYVIRPKEGEDGAREFAGGTGIHPKWDRRTATLDVWLRPQFWGQGYSGERAGAMIDLAFDRLDPDVVAVAHMDGNEKSIRAVEKYIERVGGTVVPDMATGLGRTEGGLRVETQRGAYTADRVVAASTYDVSYLADERGDVPVDGLRVAGPTAGVESQVAVAVGHGARVGLALIEAYRCEEEGIWEASAAHTDWVVKQGRYEGEQPEGSE